MMSDQMLTKEFHKILLISFGGIGDVILFFPIIKTLKDLYPNAKISLLVEPRSKSIADNNPSISKVITFDLKNSPNLKDYLGLIGDLREQKYDLALSMGSSKFVPLLLYFSGAKHRIGYATNFLKFFNTKSIPLNKNQYVAQMYFDLLKGLSLETERLKPIPEIVIPKVEDEWANEWFKKNNIDLTQKNKIVVVHPGASKMSKKKNIVKTWEANKWTQLIESLVEKDIKVVLAGGPDDEEDVNFILKHLKDPNYNIYNALGETKNLEQLGALISLSDLLVCVDSASMHVSIAIDKPLVAIFGPTNEKRVIPPDCEEKFTVIRINLHCTPCLWDKRTTTCKELSCLKELNVKMVSDVIFNKLGLISNISI